MSNVNSLREIPLDTFRLATSDCHHYLDLASKSQDSCMYANLSYVSNAKTHRDGKCSTALQIFSITVAGLMEGGTLRIISDRLQGMKLQGVNMKWTVLMRRVSEKVHLCKDAEN